MPEAHQNPRSTVAAIADLNGQRAEAMAAKYGAVAFTDYRRMLKDAEIDAVVVCAPNALHAKLSIDAMRAGRHVLCEKPMATTRAEAKRMMAVAKQTKRKLMIALNQRLMPPHIKAKQILDSGVLGRVLSFRTSFKHGGPEAWSVDGKRSWFFDRAAAVMGVTGDLGVHKADLLRWLLGQEFVEVTGQLATLDKRDAKGKLIGLDDNAYLVLKTDRGVIGSIIVSWTAYGGEENDTVLDCENGVLKIGADPEYGVIVEYPSGNRELHKLGAIASNKAQVASGIIDSFTEAILRNKPAPIDGMEGYRCLDVILAAMEAAKRGRAVRIG
jgi:predicted dehydrogenase